jgi:hypothetical protein
VAVDIGTKPDIERLSRLAYARNRAVDTEVRTITVTDDEMKWIVHHLAALVEWGSDSED